jgi:hypothetical protein
MSFETHPQPAIDVENGYENFVPEAFKADPFDYFERYGINIKPGESKFDEQGVIREDVSAVKYLPVWKDSNGLAIDVVAKRINPEKGRVRKENNPFYEYKIMEILTELGLPTIKPVAKIESNGQFMIVTERAKGFNLFEINKMIPELKAKGYTDDDLAELQKKALQQMDDLRKVFEEAGIYKDNSEDHKDHWKIQDMIFDLDIENKQIRSIIPTDWEKTKIDEQKLAEARKTLN